jgi:uncharacterized protein YlxP (DUF503 family)
MFVGIVRFELFIPASRSLKEKRRVIRSLTDAVRRHCNVAIAEIDHQDLWQRTALGVSCVAGSRAQCEKVLQQVEKTMARTVVDGAEIVDRVFSYVSMEDLV